MAKKPPEETPPADSSRADRTKPVTVTKEEAFQIYLNMLQPSINATVKILKEQGHTVSYARVHEWSKSGKWLDKRVALGKTGGLRLLEIGKTARALEVLHKEGFEFNVVSAIKGLQARAALVMADELLNSPEKPEYFIAMTRLMSDLEDMKRKGFVSDVQAPAVEPTAEVKKPAKDADAKMPALGEVILRPQFPKPSKK